MRLSPYLIFNYSEENFGGSCLEFTCDGKLYRIIIHLPQQFLGQSLQTREMRSKDFMEKRTEEGLPDHFSIQRWSVKVKVPRHWTLVGWCSPGGGLTQS